MHSTGNIGNRIGLIVGNGVYAVDVLAGLSATHDVALVSLFPKGMGMINSGVQLYVSPWEIGRMVDHFKKEGITDIVFAGDIGIYNRWDVARGIFRSIFTQPNILGRFFWENKGKLSAVRFLQFVERTLRREELNPKLASELLPSLQPPRGRFTRSTTSISDSYVQVVVMKAVEISRDQPILYVKQAVAFDDLQLIGAERESTDELLRQIGAIPKPAGAIRTVVKICPPGFDPTIDAPVIGPDTITHSIASRVDVFVIDCEHGIISRVDQCKSLAEANGMVLIGMSLTME